MSLQKKCMQVICMDDPFRHMEPELTVVSQFGKLTVLFNFFCLLRLFGEGQIRISDPEAIAFAATYYYRLPICHTYRTENN